MLLASIGGFTVCVRMALLVVEETAVARLPLYSLKSHIPQHLQCTCTCIGIRPRWVEPAPIIELTTLWTEELQDRRSCASFLETFTFIVSRWPGSDRSFLPSSTLAPFLCLSGPGSFPMSKGVIYVPVSMPVSVKHPSPATLEGMPTSRGVSPHLQGSRKL